jgi:hypothetical protein
MYFNQILSFWLFTEKVLNDGGHERFPSTEKQR